MVHNYSAPVLNIPLKTKIVLSCSIILHLGQDIEMTLQPPSTAFSGNHQVPEEKIPSRRSRRPAIDELIDNFAKREPQEEGHFYFI